MKHIDDPPTMSIKPCPDPAHTLCFRTFHCQRPQLPQQINRFRASHSASAAIVSEQLRFRATSFPNNFASEQLNRFRATSFPNNFASDSTQSLPSNSIVSEQLRFRANHQCFRVLFTTLVPINGSSILLPSKTFHDCRNIGSTTRSLPQKKKKATTLVPINGSKQSFLPSKATTLVQINGHGSTLMPMV